MDRAQRLYTVALSIVAVLLPIYSSVRYGIGISPDSLSYFAAAKSFGQGAGFIDSNGGPYVLWPPLIPLMLSSGVFLGISIENSALYINAFAFGLSVYVSIGILRRLVNDPLIFFVSAPLTLLSFACLKSSIMAWSEPIFGLFLLLSFCQLITYLQSSVSNKSALIVSALLANFAALARYTGITWILFAGFAILAMGANRSFRAKALDLVLYWGLATFGIALWTVRNILVVGCPFGCRTPAKVGPLDQVWPIINSLARTVLPMSIPDESKTILVLILLCFLTIGSFVSARSRLESKNSYARVFCLAALVYVLFQLLFLVVAFSGIANELISARYLSPLFPLIILPTLSLAAQFLSQHKLNCPARPVYRYVTALILGAWSIGSVISTVQLLQIWREDGAGDYSTKPWQESPLLAAIAHSSISGVLYSNAADFLTYKTGLPSLGLPNHGSDVGSFVTSLPNSAYGIWFSQSFRKYMIGPEELKKSVAMREMGRFADGVIYQLSPPDR
jgi:hypothetical protein